jgi:hypothetical protein
LNVLSYGDETTFLSLSVTVCFSVGWVGLEGLLQTARRELRRC